MTQAINSSANREQQRQEWIARVDRLIAEIAEWSRAEIGWQVEQDRKVIVEDTLGEYEVPTLLVSLPGGQVSVNPIAHHVVGAQGRVDLEAYPTLNRVKLLWTPKGMQVITDSNIPLRVPWNREAFIQLVLDLLSKT
jgi:hypothetical protein